MAEQATIALDPDGEAVRHLLLADAQVVLRNSTPGHGSDSVSLVLDEGYALTGDLNPPDMGGAELAASYPDRADPPNGSSRRFYPRASWGRPVV